MPDPPPQPPPGLQLAPGVYAPESALRFSFARSSGPGGQNVNKVNTKVDFWVPISALIGLHPDAAQRLRALAGRRLTQADEIHISAQSERTQDTNRSEALARLRELLVEALHRPKTRRKTKPSYGAKQRRLASKKKRSEVKSTRRRAIGD